MKDMTNIHMSHNEATFKKNEVFLEKTIKQTNSDLLLEKKKFS